MSPKEQEEARRILAQGRQTERNKAKREEASQEEQEYNKENIGRQGVLPEARSGAEEKEPEQGAEPEAGEQGKNIDALSAAGAAVSQANEQSIAERLRRLRQTYEQIHRGAIRSSFRLRNRYKQMKRLIRVIKIASAAGSSLGDIFFSLLVFFLTLNGEFLYAKVNRNYPFDTIDKTIFIAGWLLILAIAAIVAALIIIIYYYLSFILKLVA